MQIRTVGKDVGKIFNWVVLVDGEPVASFYFEDMGSRWAREMFKHGYEVVSAAEYMDRWQGAK